MVVPQNGWFIMENPIKMDDLRGKPTRSGNTHINKLSSVRRQAALVTHGSQDQCSNTYHLSADERINGRAKDMAKR